jgi:hypothetical protein
MLRFVGHLMLAAAILAGCDGLAREPAGGNQVAVDFLVVSSEDATTPVQAARYSAGLEKAFVLVCDRGALTITEIRLIAARFVLETETGACAGGTAGCASFRAEPFLVGLPLDESPLTVANGTAPLGSYSFLRFELMKLNSNDDPALAADVRDLQRSIRRSLGEWPENAAMVVAGTYTPADGEPRSFRAFFDAGAGVDLSLEPQLTFSPTSKSESITVQIDLSRLFRDATGLVLDLSALDYGQTGTVAKLPGKMEDAFVRAYADQRGGQP